MEVKMALIVLCVLSLYCEVHSFVDTMNSKTKESVNAVDVGKSHGAKLLSKYTKTTLKLKSQIEKSEKENLKKHIEIGNLNLTIELIDLRNQSKPETRQLKLLMPKYKGSLTQELKVDDFNLIKVEVEPTQVRSNNVLGKLGNLEVRKYTATTLKATTTRPTKTVVRRYIRDH